MDATTASEDPLLEEGITRPLDGDEEPISVNPDVESAITGRGLPLCMLIASVEFNPTQGDPGADCRAAQIGENRPADSCSANRVELVSRVVRATDKPPIGPLTTEQITAYALDGISKADQAIESE